MASRDIHLNFELHHCQGWQYPENLLESIRLVVHLAELIPLENEQIENPKPQAGKNKYARPVAKDLKVWFEQNYHFREEWDTKEFFIAKSKERIGGFFRTTLEKAWLTRAPIWEHTINIQISAQNFGEAYNIVVFSCGLYGKSLTLSGDPTLNRLNDIVSLFQKFAQPVIKQLEPGYALITHNHQRETYGWDVLKAKLKLIHWCNYFGPTYLQKYGKDVFLSAPGWCVEPLGEGIWYQVTERFMDSKEESLHKQVLEYFKPIGVKKVV